MDTKKYLETAIFSKYDKLLEGMAYMSQFSKTDGYVLYDTITKLGVETHTKPERQIVWSDVRKEWKGWHKPTANNPQPNEKHCIDECKHRLFKEWIKGNVDKKVDLRSVLV